MDDSAGVFGALDMGCCAGAEDDDGSDSANFEFSNRGVMGTVSPPGKHGNGVQGMAQAMQGNGVDGGVTSATFPCGIG